MKKSMKCRDLLRLAPPVICGLALVCLTAVEARAQSGTNDALKRTSAVKRDPFWPIGYRPQNVQVVSEVRPGTVKQPVNNSWNEAMSRVVINGVSNRADNEYIAVINGEVKSVGDTVSVILGNSVYTWAVDGIEPPGSVKLRRVSVR